MAEKEAKQGSESEPPQDPKAAEGEASLRSTFWETGVATALVTVVVGGFVGGFINNQAQKAITDRQFRNEIIQTANQHFLESQKAMLDKRIDLAREISSNVGRISNSGNALVHVLRQSHSDSVIAQFGASFEKSRTDWENKRITFDVLLDLYYPDKEEVSGAWSQLETAARAYLVAFVRVAKSQQDNCKTELEALLSTSRDLGDIMVAKAAAYPWTQLEAEVTKGLAVIDRIQNPKESKKDSAKMTP